MKKKLIFLDIDGTIYNEKKQVSQVTKHAVHELHERGHEVVIATGRSPFMYDGLKRELKIESHIGFNGSYVVIDDEVVLSKSLDGEALKSIFHKAHENNHAMVFMDHRGARTDQLAHPRIKECMFSLKLEYPQIQKDPLNGEVYQALLFSAESELPTYDSLFEKFDFVRWHDLSIDVLPAGGSKAVGIQKVADLLNVDMEDTIAFGDGLNDIEMLQTAGIGVAMGNGTDLTKQAADFTTAHVDDEGIFEGLKKIGLL